MDYSKIADLYDLYAVTELDVPYFTGQAQGCTRVLELMAGTGRLSILLIQAGVPLTCLDSSAEMLAILKKKLEAKRLSAPVYEMDVCNLALPERYDLIIIPFNSFGEITDVADQEQALRGIYNHLADEGRLIVTLHNPPVRRKGIDGVLRVRGSFPLPGGEGTLILSSLENFDSQTNLVHGYQFYELYDFQGVMQVKRFVEIRFSLHSRQGFEALAQEQGFRILELVGDYQGSPFAPQDSPFMIWTLVKK